MHIQHLSADAPVVAPRTSPFDQTSFPPTTSLSITLAYPPTSPSPSPPSRPLPSFIRDYSPTTSTDTPVLHIALSYATALRLHYVRLLLSKGAPASSRDPRDLNTPLHVVAARTPCAANTAIARLLATSPDTDLNALNAAGCTPLHVAAKRGNVDVARVLLVAGAAPNARCAGLGATALHMAVRGGWGELVALLLASGAAANVQDGTGATALHVAGGRGRRRRRPSDGAGGVDVAVARALVEAGADVNVQDGEGRSVMHVMAMAGSVEGVRMCLEREADLEVRDVGGRTAGMVDWRFAVETVRFEDRRRVAVAGAGVERGREMWVGKAVKGGSLMS